MVFYASAAQSETWIVRSLGVMGEMREHRWEIRQTETGAGYFLQGQDKPLYTLTMMPDESRVALANGAIRRFSAGFLLLTDLPMPVFVHGDYAPESGRHCFQEYVGEAGFQNCVEVKSVASLSEAHVPTQPGEVVFVWQKKRLDAIVGADFRAERVE